MDRICFLLPNICNDFLKDVACLMPHGSAWAQLHHNDEVGEVVGEEAEGDMMRIIRRRGC